MSYKAEYQRVHKWMAYHFGKPDKCENPDCKGRGSRFEWALIKGEDLKKARENFIMLCSKCHRSYDFKGRQKKESHSKNVSIAKKGVSVGAGKKLSESHKKNISKGLLNRLSDEQLIEIQDKYAKGITYKDLAREYGVSPSTISNRIKRLNKKCARSGN